MRHRRTLIPLVSTALALCFFARIGNYIQLRLTQAGSSTSGGGL